MKSSDVRQKFLEYFRSKGHEIVSASPVVPQDDPTLLFVNAGMNQFKDVFLGEGKRPYKRAVNSQPCVRVSGKHNDLEDVGKDTTHQTSFEMLGNWSFGDYYKKEAIEWAWELMTDVYKIPKEKLYATVFETDDESETLWQTATDIQHDHVLRCGAKDNFWEMGETGPCGPCSELHVDLGAQACDKPKEEHVCEVNGVCNRYVEFWNLVFIQYNRLKSGELEPLPETHVDTGAGLERIVSYLQGTHSNYQTDLFKPIISQIETITGKPYQDTMDGMSHRVIADHIRTLVFGIADNVLPSNEGRGYVLRRLLRRALRYAKKLDYHEPILCQLTDVVLDVMKEAFPHLEKRKQLIETVILSEEKQFIKTLDAGLQLFQKVVESTKDKGETQLSGEESFKLYDTYGFPIDLTEMLAQEQGVSIDTKAFNVALENQKKRSREDRKTTDVPLVEEKVDIDWSKYDGLGLHLSEYTDKARGGEAKLVWAPEEKVKMARHHSATHLLHEVLRQELGDHVQQAGSLVDVDRLRFDFTHFNAIDDAQLKTIEEKVNVAIQNAIPVTIEKMTLDQAKESGAMALFGEKYDADDVRVVKMDSFSIELCGGTHVDNTKKVEAFKIIAQSAIAAGTRRIEAIAGRKNVEGYQQKQFEKQQEQIEKKQHQLAKVIQEIESEGGQFDADVADTIESVTKQIKKAEKMLQKLKGQKAGSQTSEDLKQVKTPSHGAFHYLIKQCDNFDMGMLHQLSDNFIQSDAKLVVVLFSEQNEKGTVLAKCGKEVESIHCQKLVSEITNICGGGGGGKANKAQAGGLGVNKIGETISFLKNALENNLKEHLQ